MQGNQEEETESQQPRVCHPSEAGKRSRNQEENIKSTTKSRSALKAIYRSIYLFIYLSIYRSIYLSIHLSIDLSIWLSRNPWEHGKTERQKPRVPQETLTQPQNKPWRNNNSTLNQTKRKPEPIIHKPHTKTTQTLKAYTFRFLDTNKQT